MKNERILSVPICFRMYYSNYINEQFTRYVNRYCEGIVLFKDFLKKISVSYGLSDAFSNYSCRFYISVEFIDYDNFSKEDEIKINRYFHNSSNTSGSEFVSFIYKHQSGFETDLDQIKSFIFHYQFAQELFEGFIKNILPETCEVAIASLEDEPFFNYIRDFLWNKENHKERFSMSRAYSEVMKSDFELDCIYHSRLIENAQKNIDYKKEEVITDKEIFEADAAGMGGLSDIRIFLIDHKVKFYIKYHPSVIREIDIDRLDLEQKLNGYKAVNSYRDIKPGIILKLLQEKARRYALAESAKKKKQEIIGIEEGDYVYIHKIERGKELKEIGLIKEINLDYRNEIFIQYNKLNKDLSESKLALKHAEGTEIFFVIKADIFLQELRGSLKSQLYIIRFFIDKGKKNKLFKIKKIKRNF